jgi:general secretion pathway protein H
MTREAGFTLIEMLVVVAILAVALGIVSGASPRRSPVLEITGATARVTGAMRAARVRAMTEDRSVPLLVARDGHALVVDGRPVWLGYGVVVAMTDRRAVLFAPDGSSSGGTLRLQTANRGRLIRIDWLTGAILASDAP